MLGQGDLNGAGRLGSKFGQDLADDFDGFKLVVFLLVFLYRHKKEVPSKKDTPQLWVTCLLRTALLWESERRRVGNGGRGPFWVSRSVHQLVPRPWQVFDSTGEVEAKLFETFTSQRHGGHTATGPRLKALRKLIITPLGF